MIRGLGTEEGRGVWGWNIFLIDTSRNVSTLPTPSS
jgi:hypothetical protein